MCVHTRIQDTYSSSTKFWTKTSDRVIYELPVHSYEYTVTSKSEY